MSNKAFMILTVMVVSIIGSVFIVGIKNDIEFSKKCKLKGGIAILAIDDKKCINADSLIKID